ncbi:hypothetical protein ACVWZV_009343 [Bradyrhizobium sp. GM5.1]
MASCSGKTMVSVGRSVLARGSRRDRRWMSRASPIAPRAGTLLIASHHETVYEGDRREIAKADSERCLGPSRSLKSPPAYVTLPYFVSSANLSRTRPRGQSLLRCVLRMAAATDKSISTRPGASHRRTLKIAGGAAHARRFLPVTGRRGPISNATGVSQGIWASISAEAGTCLRFVASLMPDTHLQRMQRGWLV